MQIQRIATDHLQNFSDGGPDITRLFPPQENTLTCVAPFLELLYTPRAMRTSRIAPFLLAALLVACSGKNASYDLTIKAKDEAQLQRILATTTRMVERRVEAIEYREGVTDTLEDITISRKGGNTQLTLRFSTPIIAPILTEDLLEPFTMEFMEECPVEEADFVVAETQGYKRIPLGTEDVSWLLTEEESGIVGGVTMQFTPEGAQKKAELFEPRMGKNIGIFIRGLPVYRLRVEPDDVEEPVILIKVPDSELGSVFADDVNTGLHVSFSTK
ncbi:MAG: hypothetical protein PHO92_01445 [Candidatus Peribacteraceae bacterium]|nr:hypothetical protein [Candidatus Peribacteraceae bacterium]